MASQKIATFTIPHYRGLPDITTWEKRPPGNSSVVWYPLVQYAENYTPANTASNPYLKIDAQSAAFGGYSASCDYEGYHYTDNPTEELPYVYSLFFGLSIKTAAGLRSRLTVIVDGISYEFSLNDVINVPLMGSTMALEFFNLEGDTSGTADGGYFRGQIYWPQFEQPPAGDTGISTVEVFAGVVEREFWTGFVESYEV